MPFSLREELALFTCIFCFCLLTIPVILLTRCSPKEKFEESEINLRYLSNLDWRKKMFIDSIVILEELNQQQESNRSDDLGFSYLMNLSRGDFEEKGRKYSVKRTKNQLKRVWSKFGFTKKTVLTSKTVKIPLKVDWRQKGAISNVQDQGLCGMCNTFSVIENMESMVELKSKKLQILSMQQMQDCYDHPMSCNGGDSCRLLDWLQTTQTRLQPHEIYAFSRAKNDSTKCLESRNISGTTVKDYSCDDFTNHEEFILLHIANQGPLVAAINATPLKNYVNGIVQHNCDGEIKHLNHVVQIVGYDLTQDVPYYIAKNSWGVNWGINGYVHIAIGSNVCGIARKISSIIINIS